MTPEGTTLYIGGFGVLAELNNVGTAAARWADYLTVGNVKVGVRFIEVATQSVTTRYFHSDHLGSIAVISDDQQVTSSSDNPQWPPLQICN